MNNERLAKTGNIRKGQVLNPNGRPKGAKGKRFNIKERLLGKWKRHPADELVQLAKTLKDNGKYEEAADIWENLLKYFEPTRKPVESKPEPSNPDESAEAAAETFKLLEEIEQNGFDQTKGSERDGLEGGKINLPFKASPKEDLPGHKKQ